MEKKTNSWDILKEWSLWFCIRLKSGGKKGKIWHYALVIYLGNISTKNNKKEVYGVAGGVMKSSVLAIFSLRCW